jgi:hypothetical protein
MNERKMGKSVTLSLKQIQLIESIQEGESFSSKLAAIIQQWSERSGLLICYENIEDEHPVKVRESAELIYGCSDSLKGFGDSELAKEATTLWNKYGNKEWSGKKLIAALVTILGEQGWTTQIFENADQDRVELWGAKPEEKMDCEKCKNKIIDELRRVVL